MSNWLEYLFVYTDAAENKAIDTVGNKLDRYVFFFYLINRVQEELSKKKTCKISVDKMGTYSWPFFDHGILSDSKNTT